MKKVVGRRAAIIVWWCVLVACALAVYRLSSALSKQRFYQAVVRYVVEDQDALKANGTPRRVLYHRFGEPQSIVPVSAMEEKWEYYFVDGTVSFTVRRVNGEPWGVRDEQAELWVERESVCTR